MRKAIDRENFAARVFDENRGRADKIAYIDDHTSVTYGDLERAARRFAAALGAMGVRPEERVVLFMLDTVELPIAILGALYAGVVPVLINTMVPAEDLAYFVDHSSARAVFASASIADRAHDAARLVSPPPPVVVSDPEGGEATIAARIAAEEPAPAPARTCADDIALWLYSSGSTGAPKAVVHSHANLRRTFELYGGPVMGVTERDVVFSAAKLFFAYGLGSSLTFPLSAGATVVLMAERATPEAIFERLVLRRATVFCGAPTTYVAMLASPKLPAREDVALRACTSAGEALPEEVGLRFEAHFGAPILDGIGSTEMLHIFISNRIDDVRYGTSGRPVTGYEVELRDASGARVTPGEIGDLWVKGPTAALLYWRSRERSIDTFHGPWTKTGDKYRELPTGHYEYAGRSDDMLKVSGQYVAPVEVEFSLMSHPSVLEAAVVGKPDPNGLTVAWAYVVLRSGHAPSDALAESLKAHVKSKLLPHKRPRHVVFLAELPKTATGKVQRFRLRERA